MWYRIEDIDQLPSPAFVVYPDRIRHNIDTLIASVDDPARLRPHIKTNKSEPVCRMMMDAGITKFKCATIAEAEMLAQAGAQDVLLAYQPVGPAANRLLALASAFPSIQWACLIDNEHTARHLSQVFQDAGKQIPVFIDINVGMNRTGILPEEVNNLVDSIKQLTGISITGLHVYDGHLRDPDFAAREKKCDEAFGQVLRVKAGVEQTLKRELHIVAGGTPTFSIHRKRQGVTCSPGTFIYWDKGYESILKEQTYLHAGLVIARVISLPAENIVCTDLGHKAIASENPLPNRVFFLNAPELEPIGHSEEHMVFRTTKPYKVGDVLYGVPYHICPTVALHDIAQTVVRGRLSDRWETVARRRKITY